MGPALGVEEEFELVLVVVLLRRERLLFCCGCWADGATAVELAQVGASGWRSELPTANIPTRGWTAEEGRVIGGSF